MAFNQLGLIPALQKALKDAGYDSPTEVQKRAIPKVMEGVDLRISSQTGSGKTAAFLLPILQSLAKPECGRGPRALILAPTRELALQIFEQVKKYSKHIKKLSAICLCGGMPYPPQMRQLSRPYEIIVATPGRLKDFIERKKIDFRRLETFVLDEADRMLDMGFKPDVDFIAKSMPSNRQTLLFSATLEGAVAKLSDELMQDPEDICVHSSKSKHENIAQNLIFTDGMKHKSKLLYHLLDQEQNGSTILFTSSKRHADELALELHDAGYKAKALHGDMHQRQRTRVLDSMKEGKTKILVATDVAARGVDVKSITQVINFDLPRNIEDYVHRIGRTGRAGQSGTALSFASHRDRHLVSKIEKFTGQSIEVVEIPGLESREKAPAKGEEGKAGRSSQKGRPKRWQQSKSRRPKREFARRK